MLWRIFIPAVIGTLTFGVIELLRQKLNGNNEISRKAIHIIHGFEVIAWFVLLGKNFVIGFEILFFIVMIVARVFGTKWPLIKNMYQVKRVSWGEFFYPVGVIVTALIAQHEWIFIAAILQLAITDTAAALLGKQWGRHSEYKIFGQTKSVIGTATFIVVAALVLLASLSYGGQPFNLAIVLALPLLLAVVENISPVGSDNFTLPVLAAIALNIFKL